MRFEELERAIAAVRQRVVAADVTGDVSSYRYRSRFKRLLSMIDGQPEVLPEWQDAQREINRRLLRLLAAG
jgi:diphthamide synthase (EF-2-diphthine--ammonia ligase)